jgi:hypothetical protein
MVWGSGRFVAGEPGRRLDLAATVRASARAGGLPVLCFAPTRQQREVWLWLDDATADPTLTRLANEVEASLAAHGLAVERAWFWGVPERLEAAGGQVFAPRELDERRHLALVAVLTDGRLLERQCAADSRRWAVEALLRQLSH